MQKDGKLQQQQLDNAKVFQEDQNTGISSQVMQIGLPLMTSRNFGKLLTPLSFITVFIKKGFELSSQNHWPQPQDGEVTFGKLQSPINPTEMLQLI